jgi:hypothetical protein
MIAVTNFIIVLVALANTIFGWMIGCSTMWFYLRFSKQLRNEAEHENALKTESYHPKNSHGVVGAIYNVDAAMLLKFAKSYYKKQIDHYRALMETWEGGKKCEK